MATDYALVGQIIGRMIGTIILVFIFYMLYKLVLKKEKIGKNTKRIAWTLFVFLMLIGIVFLSIAIPFLITPTEGTDIAAMVLSFISLLLITVGVLLILATYEKLGSWKPGKSRKPEKPAAWLLFLLLELTGIFGFIVAIITYYNNEFNYQIEQLIVSSFFTLFPILFIPLGILLLLAAYGKYGDLD